MPPKGSAAVSETGELGAGCFGGLWNTRVCLKSQRAPPPGVQGARNGRIGGQTSQRRGKKGFKRDDPGRVRNEAFLELRVGSV